MRGADYGEFGNCDPTREGPGVVVHVYVACEVSL